MYLKNRRVWCRPCSNPDKNIASRYVCMICMTRWQVRTAIGLRYLTVVRRLSVENWLSTELMCFASPYQLFSTSLPLTWKVSHTSKILVMFCEEGLLTTPITKKPISGIKALVLLVQRGFITTTASSVKVKIHPYSSLQTRTPHEKK